jgi:hypothetical protein
LVTARSRIMGKITKIAGAIGSDRSRSVKLRLL